MGKRTRYLQTVLAAALFLAAACRQSSRPAASSGDTAQHTSVAAASPTPADTAPLAALVDSLARLPGDFSSWEQGRWEFNGDAQVLSAFDRYADTAVVRLVACLDRTELAKATARGRPVPIGVMCYWALRRLAYYEWQGNPGFPDKWPGEINPTATASDLRAAKEAWLRVVREGKYSLT